MDRRGTGPGGLTSRALPLRAAADLETRASVDDHGDLRLWLRLMTVHKLIDGEVRRRLRSRFGISLARFDLMAQLERSPDGVRMGDLSRRLMVTGGNVTQLVRELVREGAVERTPEPDNRRAVVIRLTPRGRRHFAVLARAHEQWIADLFDGLSRLEKAQLQAILGRHKRLLATRPAGPGEAAPPTVSGRGSPAPAARNRRS